MKNANLIFLILLLVIGFCLVLVLQNLKISSLPELFPTPSPLTSDQFRVVKVIDGDTVKVSGHGGEQTIRLIGIDTPEIVAPGRPVECFGKEASDYLKNKLEATIVELQTDSTQDIKDKYGRSLAYIYLDEQNINLNLIQEGYAREYTYRKAYAFQTEFKQAEESAKNQQIGLWNPQICPSN